MPETIACMCVYDNEADYKKWSGCAMPFKEWAEGIEAFVNISRDRFDTEIVCVMFNERGYLDYMEAKGLTDSRETKSAWAAWTLLSHAPLQDKIVMANKMDRDQRLFERVL